MGIDSVTSKIETERKKKEAFQWTQFCDLWREVAGCSCSKIFVCLQFNFENDFPSNMYRIYVHCSISCVSLMSTF